MSMQESIYITEKLLLFTCSCGKFLFLSVSVSFHFYQLQLSWKKFVFGLDLHTQVIPGSSLWCHYKKTLDFSLLKMQTRNEREVPCVRVCTWHCISLSTVQLFGMLWSKVCMVGVWLAHPQKPSKGWAASWNT